MTFRLPKWVLIAAPAVLLIAIALVLAVPVVSGKSPAVVTGQNTPRLVQANLDGLAESFGSYAVAPGKWRLDNYRPGEVVVACTVRVYGPETVTIQRLVTTVADDHVLIERLPIPVGTGVPIVISDDPSDSLISRVDPDDSSILVVDGLVENSARILTITYVPAFIPVQVRLEQPPISDGYIPFPGCRGWVPVDPLANAETLLEPAASLWITLNGEAVTSTVVDVPPNGYTDVVVALAVPHGITVPPCWEFRLVAGGGAGQSGGVMILTENTCRFLVSEKAIRPDG